MSICVSHVEFFPTDHYLDPDLQGRLTCCINGFVWLLNLPVHREGDRLRIQFPVAEETMAIHTVLSFPLEIREEIERQIEEQLGEAVR